MIDDSTVLAFDCSTHRVFVVPHSSQPRLFFYRWVALHPHAGRVHYEAVVPTSEAEELVAVMRRSPDFTEAGR